MIDERLEERLVIVNMLILIRQLFYVVFLYNGISKMFFKIKEMCQFIREADIVREGAREPIDAVMPLTF